MVDSVSGISQLQALKSSSLGNTREQRGVNNADNAPAENVQDSVEISSEALSLAEVASAEESAAQVRDLLAESLNETLGRTDSNFDTLL